MIGMSEKDYTDPAINPYADDPTAHEAARWFLKKWPHLTEPDFWEFYIKTRPEVEAENARYAAAGFDVSFDESPIAEAAKDQFKQK